jgi:hypothetical protein
MKTISMSGHEYSAEVTNQHAGDLTESRWRQLAFRDDTENDGFVS